MQEFTWDWIGIVELSEQKLGAWEPFLVVRGPKSKSPAASGLPGVRSPEGRAVFRGLWEAPECRISFGI